MGSAIEHAARALVETQRSWEPEEQKAVTVDFQTMFAGVESEDEVAAGLSEALDILRTKWRETPFQASHVAQLINEPPSGEESVSQTLRDCVEASGRRANGLISAKSVGRWLKMNMDTPLLIEDRTATLIRTGDAAKHAAWYRVKMT